MSSFNGDCSRDATSCSSRSPRSSPRGRGPCAAPEATRTRAAMPRSGCPRRQRRRRGRRSSLPGSAWIQRGTGLSSRREWSRAGRRRWRPIRRSGSSPCTRRATFSSGPAQTDRSPRASETFASFPIPPPPPPSPASESIEWGRFSMRPRPPRWSRGDGDGSVHRSRGPSRRSSSSSRSCRLDDERRRQRSVVVMGERISGRGEAERAASEYRHEHRRTTRPPPLAVAATFGRNI